MDFFSIVALFLIVGGIQYLAFVALNWFAATGDVPPHFYRTDISGFKDGGKCSNCRCGKTVIEGEGSV